MKCTNQRMKITLKTQNTTQRREKFGHIRSELIRWVNSKEKRADDRIYRNTIGCINRVGKDGKLRSIKCILMFDTHKSRLRDIREYERRATEFQKFCLHQPVNFTSAVQYNRRLS
ncbi:hypothetical protein WICPIJ_003307 [Wickerhamomyces pijperi]|uniref:Uncharacterized protein n=1 Tax=Wickerhamomyces pijperi TaxID=599730 RepID=A0A9P8Q9W2_WICPI|nr:hypothetical protein WICPIJ_003307 [Wickerhamomyces pijperi]